MPRLHGTYTTVAAIIAIFCNGTHDTAKFDLWQKLNLGTACLSPSRRRSEGTNSARLFTPGETKALAKSKVHQ
jgi:hypothetical protein